MYKINEYDKKLLYYLDRNAHISLTQLSKLLKRSKQFIIYRIKRLEKEKIILGYRAIIDASKLGYITYRIYFKLQNMKKEKEEEMLEYLKNKPNIWSIARLHGKWDYAIFPGVKSIKELHEIWDSFLQIYKPFIKEKNIAVYAPIINFNRTFFMDKNSEKTERIYGDGIEISHNDIDLRIISEYGHNVREPLTNIAKKIKISVITLIKRIRQMEKNNVIRGYKLDMSLQALKYMGYRVDISLNSLQNKNQILEYCRNHKNIYQVMQTIGGSDFEMSIIVKDHYELLKILNNMQEKFDSINEFTYFEFSAIPKLSMIPD